MSNPEKTENIFLFIPNLIGKAVLTFELIHKFEIVNWGVY